MPGRNSWVLPGNGILSGVTLGTGAPDSDDPNAEYGSPWAQAVREMWEKRLAAGSDRQGPAASTQGSPPFESLPYASGASSWPAFPNSNPGMLGPFGASASDAIWPTASPRAPAQRPDFTGSPNASAFLSAAWPHANQSLTDSAEVIPVSYQGGTRPSWDPSSSFGSGKMPWPPFLPPANFPATTPMQPTSEFAPPRPMAADLGDATRFPFDGGWGADLSTHSALSPVMIPASYQEGATKPWWGPVGPVDVFDPWVKGALESLRKTITHFQSGSQGSGGRKSEEECEEMYAEDSDICRAVKSRTCWAQAMERYSNCNKGKQIPLLGFGGR
jgi:hypothetical protein